MLGYKYGRARICVYVCVLPLIALVHVLRCVCAIVHSVEISNGLLILASACLSVRINVSKTHNRGPVIYIVSMRDPF